MKGYNTREEAIKAMEALKQIKKGDTIKIGFLEMEIKELFYYDVYVETGHEIFKEAKDTEKYYIFFDIEFRDTRWNYRHWKSSYDGGTLIQK